MTFQDSSRLQQQPPPPQDNVVDTGSGFLVGVDPAQPRRAADWTGNSSRRSSSSRRTASRQRVFTAEEVEAFRQQEKDKLYGRTREMGDAA